MRTSSLVALLLVAATANAQDSSGMTTGLSVNGRFWATLSSEAKATYVIAVGEGISEVAFRGSNSCACLFERASSALRAVSGSDKTSYHELAASVDFFYKDPTNRAVPVIKALVYVTQKMKGATSQELDDLAAKLRKDASH
jgi:hypothetical protein